MGVDRVLCTGEKSREGNERAGREEEEDTSVLGAPCMSLHPLQILNVQQCSWQMFAAVARRFGCSCRQIVHLRLQALDGAFLLLTCYLLT